MENANNLEILYKKLRKEYSLLPYNNKGMRIRELLHPYLLKLMQINYSKYTIKEIVDLRDNKNKPVLYVANHTNIHDIAVACNSINEHVTVLLENGVQHGDLNGLIMKLNSVIFIDRHDKISKENSIKAMVNTILNGKSVLMFPEGTWNREPSTPMLYCRWGAVKVAKIADCDIVPIVLEYNNYDIHVIIGKEIKVNDYSNMSDAMQSIRDAMATIKWNLWETYGSLKKEERNIEYHKAIIDKYLKEYPKLNIAYEDSVIYKPFPTESEVYESLNNINFNLNNAFLLSNEENRKQLIKKK